MRKMTKKEALEIYGVDMDHVHFSKSLQYRKADVDDKLRGDREEEDDNKLSDKLNEMVDALLVAAPTLNRQATAHFLMHNPHGRKLAEHLNSLSKKEQPMPQVDFMKVISILEQTLLGRAPNAKEFAKLYENDIEFRKQWRDLTDAKRNLSPNMTKGRMATLTPTSTMVGNPNYKDDSAEAVRLLQEMAARNGSSFEAEFTAPENAKLAARTYSSATLPSSIPYSAEEANG
jgi:hypothetical protein